MKTSMRVAALLAAGLAAGCASVPPAPPAPAVKLEQKLAWILELEDKRILKIDLPPPPAPAVVKGRRPAPPPPRPASSPDLAVLVADPEARVRRRAALAVGRVGLREGVGLVVPLLADPDPEVRQMAAFALGLIGLVLDDGTPPPDPALIPAIKALTDALADADPMVRGRAAEALGLIGAADAAPAVGKLAAGYARTAAVTALQPDDERWPGVPDADAFRLAMYALVRLRAYEPLAAAVLDQNGRPVSAWWPVAYALQRIGDARAAPALRELLKTPGRHTAAFAARGLGAAKDAASVPALVGLLDPARYPVGVVVSAVRALGQIGDAAAVKPLAALVSTPGVDPNLRLEAIGALGALGATEALPAIQDLLTEPWPALRGAALRASAAIDRDGFVLLLSGLDPDPHWTVRAALADVLGTLPAEAAAGRLKDMLGDEDKRVIPPVLGGLVRLKVAEVDRILLERLKDPDPGVREAAARHLGALKPPDGAEALREAYTTGLSDGGYDARAAALSALAAYGADAAAALKTALGDRDWAVRVHAARLLAGIEPTGQHWQAIRPAPVAPVAYDDAALVSPPNSPHAFIDTAKGTIEIELAVLDAPLTVRNFTALAAKGFFNGTAIHRVVPNFVVQDGDPRGDGSGGPGYSIRDELNDRPYLRGTVGMALSWRDTGGSQFFITHSPQPHLDARYTAFGHVVSGMEVVDRIQHGDVIQRIRVWDGKTMK
jgi:cyclophilin family peptidyl-prolyl cis-trans isomerase/HEAT repeat protein